MLVLKEPTGSHATSKSGCRNRKRKTYEERAEGASADVSIGTSNLTVAQKVRLMELQEKFKETMPEGTSPMPRYPTDLFQGFEQDSSSASSSTTPVAPNYNKQPKAKGVRSVETQTDAPIFTGVEPPPPPIIRTYAGPFYQVPGGDKFHVFPRCWGLRNATRTNTIEMCRCCAENGGDRMY